VLNAAVVLRDSRTNEVHRQHTAGCLGKVKVELVAIERSRPSVPTTRLDS